MARDFNGSSQSASSAAVNVASNIISISAWSNADNWTSATNIFLELGVDWFNNVGIAIYYSTGAGAFRVASVGNAGENSANYAAPSTGAWHHFGVTIDRTQAGSNQTNFWLDGVLQTPTSRVSNANSSNFSNATLYLGARTNSTLWHNGRVAELALYSGVSLEASLWAALAKGYSPKLIRQDKLYAHWPLIGKASPEQNSKAGNGMSLTGSPPAAAHPRIIMPRASALVLPFPPAAANLTADPLVVGSPVFGTPALTQTHALGASDLVAGAPVFGTPALTQVHALAAADLIVGSPVLGAPALTQAHELAADDLVIGSPVLGTPALTQAHALVAEDLIVGSPLFGTPALGQGGDLLADDLIVGSPVFGTPALTQAHELAANDLVIGSPSFGAPALTQLHQLIASSPILASPVFGTPALTQAHALAAADLIVGSPVFGAPALALSEPNLPGSLVCASVTALTALDGVVSMRARLDGSVAIKEC